MSFTVDKTNWQQKDKINEIAVAMNERMLAAKQIADLNPGGTYDPATSPLVTFDGKVYQGVEPENPFNPTGVDWREFINESVDDNDLQGIKYYGGASGYILQWWGWERCQYYIEQICTNFVRSIDEVWSSGSPPTAATDYIEMYTFATLVEDVKASNPNLFQFDNWTRKYSTNQVTSGYAQAGDFVTNTMIKEITGCLELMTKTTEEHDVSDMFLKHTTIGLEEAPGADLASCNIVRQRAIDEFNDNFPTYVALNSFGFRTFVQKSLKFFPGVGNGYRWDGRLTDCIPQLKTLPHIDNAPYTWNLYASAYRPGGNNFLAPNTNGAVIASMNEEDFKAVLSGFEAGYNSVINDDWVGGSSTCPIEDYPITCSNDNDTWDFGLRFPIWVVDWSFTN